MSKVVACIIARTNSTRLPQKVLKKVGEHTLIEYLIYKIKRSRLINEIYLCTSIDPEDKILLEVADRCGIKSYAGSRESVIDRMLDVAKIENADTLIRITGDNIFTDEVYLDIMLKHHIERKADYTRTEKLPLGVTPEIINVEALKKCYTMMNPEESQYLMLYMFQPEKFNCLVVLPELKHQKPNMTLTVDTPADYDRTLQILGAQKQLLDINDVLQICEKENIPYTKYSGNGIVKFPANLSVYFKSYRTEMDLRIQNSTIVQLDDEAFNITKMTQNV